MAAHPAPSELHWFLISSKHGPFQGPPGASKTFRGLQAAPRNFQDPPAPGAKAPTLGNVGAFLGWHDIVLPEGLGYSHQGGKSMYIVYIHIYGFGPLGWLEAGLCLPMYGRSPEGLYTSILYRLLPLSYPTGEKADVFLQCLTTLVMGGNGLSRLGGNLGSSVYRV